MNWIKVTHRDEMPKDKPFLALWKGLVSLTAFHDGLDLFYIMFDPSDYAKPWLIQKDRENKFTHWMPLPEQPKD